MRCVCAWSELRVIKSNGNKSCSIFGSNWALHVYATVSDRLSVSELVNDCRVHRSKFKRAKNWKRVPKHCRAAPCVCVCECGLWTIILPKSIKLKWAPKSDGISFATASFCSLIPSPNAKMEHAACSPVSLPVHHRSLDLYCVVLNHSPDNNVVHGRYTPAGTKVQWALHNIQIETNNIYPPARVSGSGHICSILYMLPLPSTNAYTIKSTQTHTYSSRFDVRWNSSISRCHRINSTPANSVI